MEPLSNNKQRKNYSYKDILAQPLELRESLRIRDGLRESNASSVSWMPYTPARWFIPQLTHYWVSNN